MEGIFAKNIQGNCTVCKCSLEQGGWIYLNSQNNIEKLLCSICYDALDNAIPVKKGRLVVKKLSGFFNWMNGWYQIVSARNLIIKNNIIKEKELLKIIDNPNIEVIIKQ